MEMTMETTLLCRVEGLGFSVGSGICVYACFGLQVRVKREIL